MASKRLCTSISLRFVVRLHNRAESVKTAGFPVEGQGNEYTVTRSTWNSEHYTHYLAKRRLVCFIRNLRCEEWESKRAVESKHVR